MEFNWSISSNLKIKVLVAVNNKDSVWSIDVNNKTVFMLIKIHIYNNLNIVTIENTSTYTIVLYLIVITEIFTRLLNPVNNIKVNIVAGFKRV